MICRPAAADDTPFIVETFARSFRAASSHAEGLSKGQVSRLITNLLANGWEATVYCQDGMILGWAVYREGNRLAWVYVRDIVRGQGIARWLVVNHARIDMTKRIETPFMPNRLRSKFRLIHRPFACVA